MLALEIKEWDRDIALQEMHYTLNELFAVSICLTNSDDALQESKYSLQKVHT